MLYFVLVYIILSVIHICASNSVDKQCLHDSKKILLQSHNYMAVRMNNELKKKCGDTYDFEDDNANYGSRVSGVGAMIEANKTHCNVINLGVNDYYRFSHDYTSSNGLAYAGDLGVTSERLTCSVKNDTNTKYCDYNYVKMVSDRVTDINGGHLYNIITRMNYSNYYTNEVFVPDVSCYGVVDNSELDIVLVCSDTIIDTRKFSQQFYPLRFRYAAHCNQHEIKKYKNTLVAVLTSKPFPMEYELTVPVIFYETLFTYEEDLGMFPNAVVSGWKILKYPIIKLLERMEWRRVAIITDDSPYSVEFEEELTELFREQVVMYTVKRCEDKSCDHFFKNVFASLKEEGTRVLIANFRKKYMKYLKPAGYGWVMRDLYSAKEWTKIGSGCSVTLAPQGHDSAKYSLLGLNHTLAKHTKIVESIKHIYNAHHKMASQKNINSILRNQFYRQLANQTRKYIKSMDYVSRVYDEKSRSVAYITVKRNGASVDAFTPSWIITDVPNCTFKSNNYLNPCNDNEFILIMLVTIVFATTMLLVIVYFQNSSPMHYVPF